MLNPGKHMLRRITFTAILLGTAVSHGQDEDTGLPAAPPAGPASADAKIPEGNDAGAKPATGRERTSPFEYEASEQISEDLPVSFPVDI